MKQYIVDAFTNKIFSGNPAAVCVMEQWIDEEIMKKIAAENNLSETAFIVKEKEGYRLRWFIPGTEVEICGHATLSSAFVILNYYDTDKDKVTFNTMSGELTVSGKGKRNRLCLTEFLSQIIDTGRSCLWFGPLPDSGLLVRRS